MSYSARILADSVNDVGDRLVTYEIVFPRIVLAEFNTHCMLARNSASSRAIPVPKMLRQVMTNPFTPPSFGRNEPGMQSTRPLSPKQQEESNLIWMLGRARAVATVLQLLLGIEQFCKFFGTSDHGAYVPSTDEIMAWLDEHGAWLDDLTRGVLDDEDARRSLNVHKQQANRLLEPFLWHTVITTATDWSNFFALRNHADAQAEIRVIAAMMQELYDGAQPRHLLPGGWHLPLLQDDEREDAQADPETWARICSARCARVSYLTHDGRRDQTADLALYERLTSGGHLSPLEHIGQAMSLPRQLRGERSGKFRGFVQFRKLIPNEDDFAKVLAARSSATI